jgi:hypothetical protein
MDKKYLTKCKAKEEVALFRHTTVFYNIRKCGASCSYLLIAVFRVVLVGSIPRPARIPK